MKALRVVIPILLLCAVASAAELERAVNTRSGVLYLSPATNAQRVGDISPGREVAIVSDQKDWVQVFIHTDSGQDVTGWMLNKGIVRKSTPNGDKIIFGAASDAENLASTRRGSRQQAQDAMRLYYRLAEYFPQSPLAPEAYYRSADIRWQLDSAESKSRPSAKEQDPDMRLPIDEQFMKEVRKKYPNTKWHALAQYNMIDNKLCGEWKGEAKCPERESEIYEEYVKDFPTSPKAAEALYNAASRQAALVDIYKADGNASKASSAKSRALALAQRAASIEGQGDWPARAQYLIFRLQQDIPTYLTKPE